MNRRNFILGLGAAATLSGAASVTSAAIQSGAPADADFRVVSAEALEVSRNGELEESDGSNADNTLNGVVNDSDTGFTDGTEGTLNFSGGSPVYQTDGPNITVDSSTNSGLNMSLATLNDNSTNANRNSSEGGTLYYSDRTQSDNSASGTDILAVENLGAASQDVGVSYTYGTDAGSNSDQVDQATVNSLFRFVRPDGTVISPTDGTGGHNSNYLTVDSGVTKDVGLVLNYSEAIETEMTNALSTGFGGSASDADLLDTVEFGVQQ